MVVWPLRMVVQVRGFRDPFVPLSEDLSFLVLETFWGTVWIAQGILILGLAVAFWTARGPEPLGDAAAGDSTGPQVGAPLRASPAWWAAGGLTLSLVVTLALSSHAMGVESGRSLAVVADGIHALAAGSWVGALCLILVVGRTRMHGTSGSHVFVAQLRSFSPMALVSVPALIVMGVFLSWTHLRAPSDLWDSSYGRILSAKVLLAGGAFLFGLLNWRRGLPASDTVAGQQALRRRGAWEVSMAAGVLLLTAVLVQSARP
jgi:putative copper export protein